MTLLYTKEQKAPKLIEQENALLNYMNLGSISAFIW